MEPWTILIASLVGSMHCATMCGPIAAVVGASAPGGQPGARRLALLGYHAGRGIGYAGLGATAGWLGGGLDRAGAALLGIADVAAIATATVLVLVAIRPWLPSRAPLLAIGRSAKPPRLAARIAGVLARGGRGAAPAVGLFTALLPCGWLWSFVALAAGTASAAAGAVLMIAMWAGSLPALSSVGVAASWLSRIAGRRTRAFGSIAMLVLAGLMLAGMVTRRLGDEPDGAAVPPCHAH